MVSHVRVPGVRSNIAKPTLGTLDERVRYANQPPRAPNGRANGAAITMQIAPSAPINKKESRAASAESAPHPAARAPVVGRTTHEMSPPSKTGNRTKIVNP